MAAMGCRTLGLTLTPALPSTPPSPPKALVPWAQGVSCPSSSPLAPPQQVPNPNRQLEAMGSAPLVFTGLGGMRGAGGVGTVVAQAGGSTHSPIPR